MTTAGVNMNSRPSITEVIGRYVELKRAGKEEWRGLCPFHDEKTPSFYVNDEKGVFNCFGCGEHGDVFDFVMKKLGVDFKGALAHLGQANGTIPITKPRKSIERQAAEVITIWASEMSLVLSAKMRALLEQARLARTCLSIKGADEALESYERQLEILNILDEDLFNPQLLLELWKQRASVEVIVNG